MCVLLLLFFMFSVLLSLPSCHHFRKQIEKFYLILISGFYMTLKQVSLVILIITSQYLKNVLNQKQIILFQNYYYFLLI